MEKSVQETAFSRFQFQKKRNIQLSRLNVIHIRLCRTQCHCLFRYSRSISCNTNFLSASWAELVQLFSSQNLLFFTRGINCKVPSWRLIVYRTRIRLLYSGSASPTTICFCYSPTSAFALWCVERGGESVRARRPVVVARVARSDDSSAAARESRSRWFFQSIRYRIHDSSFASFSFSFFSASMCGSSLRRLYIRRYCVCVLFISRRCGRSFLFIYFPFIAYSVIGQLIND